MAAFLSGFSSALVLGIGVPLILFVAWRTLLLVPMIHYLRLRRMSPSDLNAKLEREKIVIIDLLNFEDGVTSVGIPGAIRIDLVRLRGRSRLVIPRELELILSCSSVGGFRRARVARSWPEGNSGGLDIGRRTQGMDQRGLPSHFRSE